MRLTSLWLLLCAFSFASPLHAACPPEGRTLASLQALKALQFTVPDAAERTALAQGLVDCLGDPDPQVRDGIAIEGLTRWMREKQLDADAVRALQGRLLPMLDGEDPQGFRKPFAALALSEVARTDRIEPWMTPGERAAAVARAAAYLSSVDDYRGFDDREGWRHGVAHGADWVLQLALNPALDRAQLDALLGAIASQAVPVTGHAYVFGEGGRLARPAVYAAQRGLLSDADWTTWFTGLSAKLAPPPNYANAAWLARRHDLMAFLMSAYIEADNSEDAKIRALKPAIVAAVKAVP